jgi:hypothetical protein
MILELAKGPRCDCNPKAINGSAALCHENEYVMFRWSAHLSRE